MSTVSTFRCHGTHRGNLLLRSTHASLSLSRAETSHGLSFSATSRAILMQMSVCWGPGFSAVLSLRYKTCVTQGHLLSATYLVDSRTVRDGSLNRRLGIYLSGVGCLAPRLQASGIWFQALWLEHFSHHSALTSSSSFPYPQLHCDEQS